RIYLNMVAGGFKNDLEALNDHTPHDERYTRLVEYTTVIMNLLSGGGSPVSVDGRYYRITNVKMTPALPPALLPGVFVSGSSDAAPRHARPPPPLPGVSVSGSSDAGLAAARQRGALAVRYPKPVAEYEASGTAPD